MTTGITGNGNDILIRDVLVKIFERLDQLEARLDRLETKIDAQRPALTENWAPVADASRILGLSQEQIRDRIRDGRWEYGRHYVNASDGAIPRYSINLLAVRKLLAKPPEQRRPARRA